MSKLAYTAVALMTALGGLFFTIPVSAQVVDTIAPSTPAITSASASAAKIDVTWSVSSDNVAVTGYNFYRNGILVAKTTGNSFSDKGLATSTSYNYSVAAFDAANNLSSQSPQVTFMTLASSSDTLLPSVPSGLTATVSSSSQINLNWLASSDNVGVQGYTVYRNGVVVGSTNSLNFADVGLMPSTTYSYSIAAFDAAGNLSTQSSLVTATTFAVSPDSVAPSMPTSLTAIPLSSSKIRLSWIASTDNVAVKGYNIFRNDVLVGTSSGTTFVDKGLLAQTSYNYKVSAFDAAGNTSAFSNTVSATTLNATVNHRNDDDDDGDMDRDREHGNRHHGQNEKAHHGQGKHNNHGQLMKMINDHHSSRVSRSGRD